VADFTFDARSLPTSTLLALATNPDALMRALDPDGEIERMEDEPGGVRRARELFEQRARIVSAAIAAEVDRRIPIPKGEG